ALARDVGLLAEVEHRPVLHHVLPGRQALRLQPGNPAGQETAFARPALLGARQLGRRGFGRVVGVVRHHSPFAPAAPRIGPHLATSAVRWAFRAAGVGESSGTGSGPSAARRSITFWSFSAAWGAGGGFPTTSTYRPRGTHLRGQPLAL